MNDVYNTESVNLLKAKIQDLWLTLVLFLKLESKDLDINPQSTKAGYGICANMQVW